eukprot:COSAG05_NODE_1770_length_4114_cov_1.871113_3_plen_153_part_00
MPNKLLRRVARAEPDVYSQGTNSQAGRGRDVVALTGPPRQDPEQEQALHHTTAYRLGDEALGHAPPRCRSRAANSPPPRSIRVEAQLRRAASGINCSVQLWRRAWGSPTTRPSIGGQLCEQLARCNAQGAGGFEAHRTAPTGARRRRSGACN